jgi:hypothetical protein
VETVPTEYLRPDGRSAWDVTGVDPVAVLGVDSAAGVLDDELGPLTAGLRAGAGDRVGLAVEKLRRSLRSALLDRPAAIGAGFDRDRVLCHVDLLDDAVDVALGVGASHPAFESEPFRVTRE